MSDKPKRTHGSWRKGSPAGTIVADCPEPNPGACRVCSEGTADFYGGHVICESARESDRPILAAAPDLHAALEAAPEPPELVDVPLVSVPRAVADWFTNNYLPWLTVRAAALAQARGESNPAKAARVEHLKRLLEQGKVKP